MNLRVSGDDNCRRASVFALLLALAAIGPASTQEELAGVASVIDDDTIEIHGERVRLYGVDAPESRQFCVRPTGERWRCGQQASFALADLIRRSIVSYQPRDRDRYGRIVAVCFKGISDLNRWIVEMAGPSHIADTRKATLLTRMSARQSRTNIWSGDFDMPWDWRAQPRSG